MPAMALRVGLTGGIGSGKSTVAAMLARLGATVVDTDLIARQLTEPGGAAMAAIGAAFGPGFITATGGLDRTRMRQLAFNDPTAKRRLEAILHPRIGEETERQFIAAAAPTVVFDVPLLVESDRWRSRVDKVLVVDCSEATQRARVLTRPGWSAAAAGAVIAQQADRSTRRASADAVIFNDGIGLEELGRNVDNLWQQWQC